MTVQSQIHVLDKPMRRSRRVALCILSVLAQPVLSQSPTPCFDTIGSLNSVMQTELTRIRNGATPQDAYMYNLCNNTFFDATTSILEPVLNNVMFVCGETGDRLGRCVILGGSLQVQISDSTVDIYPIQELSFMGITFSSFESNPLRTGTSIGAYASSTTTATFMDCAWEEFTSDFVIRQNATGGVVIGSMTVEIKKSSISAGSSGVVFDNNAGLLRINEIDVSDVSAAAFLATANNGASFLSGMTITLADVNSITFTTAGGSQTVTNSTVTLMTRISDAFYVEDEGSTLLLEGVTIERNQIQADPWTAVAARTNSVAQISSTTIAENTGVEFGIVSFNSLVTVQDTILRQNTGTESDGSPSAPIFAITDAQITLNRVQLIDNTDFSGAVVALIRSSVTINRSCFQGGMSEFVVFIANDASYMVSENFVDNLVSTRCQATGPRLFQENDDSGCFLGSTTCEGTCLLLADQTTCLADDIVPIAPVPTETTTPPSIAPMVAPTVTRVPTKSPMRSETIIPSVLPIRNVTLVPTRRPSLSPVRSPVARPIPSPPVRPPTTISPDGRPVPTIRPSIEPTTVPSITFKPSGTIVPSFSSAPSLIPSFFETTKPTYKHDKKMCMMMKMGMRMGGKGGMRMNKGSKDDDDDEECYDDKSSKGMMGGKGSGKMGKGKDHTMSGKGLYFIPEYEQLWKSPSLLPSISLSSIPPSSAHISNNNSSQQHEKLFGYVGSNQTNTTTHSTFSKEDIKKYQNGRGNVTTQTSPSQSYNNDTQFGNVNKSNNITSTENHNRR